MKNKIRIVFIGSGNFAKTILEYISSVPDFFVSIVVTHSPKKAGRNKNENIFDPCEIFGMEKKITVLTPENLDDSYLLLKDVDPHFIVVCSYRHMISSKILNLPKICPLNIHPSLLPKYRGATPIHSALKSGDPETGVSIIKMNDKLDAGNIVTVKREKILIEDTFNTLSERLAKLSSYLITDAIFALYKKEIASIPQKKEGVSYTSRFTKESGLLDFKKTAFEIYNTIRAYNPEPGTYTFFKGKRLKILSAKFSKNSTSYNFGEVFLRDNEVCIAAKEGYISLGDVQIEGKNKISASEFIKGRQDFIGTIL